MFKIGDTVRTIVKGYRTTFTGDFPEDHAPGTIELIDSVDGNILHAIRWSTTPDKVSDLMWLAKELILFNPSNNRNAVCFLLKH